MIVVLTAGIRVAAVLPVLLASGLVGELPENLRANIDKAVTDYATSCKGADDKLLKAFDSAIEQIRKNPRIAPESKQSLIETVNGEKATFEKHDTIPFSNPMRQAASQHLASIDKARTRAAKAYDVAIDHLQRKAKDDTAASSVTEEKKKVLAPKIIGHWECTGTNFRKDFTWALYSNGTVGGEGTWSFEGEKLVLRVGTMIDTCHIGADGKTLRAANQRGGTYTGKLVFPNAER